MEEPCDAAVIAASLTEPTRFGELFDRHAATLFRYFMRRVGPDEADTLLGELFRIAFERRQSYDRERPNARPWLYGIATNLLAKHRRSEARRLRATATLAARRIPADDGVADVVDNVEALEMWSEVSDAVGALPESERDVVLLYVWEELSYDEIAVALDVPVGTVRSRLNRARTRLRRSVPTREKIEP